MRISSNYTFTLCELPLSTKKLLNFLFRSSLVLPSLFGFLPFKSFVFHRLLILSHPVVWQCKLRWRTMEAIGNNQNQVTLYRSSHWELLCKRYVRVCRVFRSALDEKVIPKGGCFSPFVLLEIRTGSLSQKFWCSGTRNIFRTGTFFRIFNFPT